MLRTIINENKMNTKNDSGRGFKVWRHDLRA